MIDCVLLSIIDSEFSTFSLVKVVDAVAVSAENDESSVTAGLPSVPSAPFESFESCRGGILANTAREKKVDKGRGGGKKVILNVINNQ